MSRSEPRPEYDFREGIRGRHAHRISPERTRELDPDLAERYPDSASVNEALRQLPAKPARKPRPVVK